MTHGMQTAEGKVYSAFGCFFAYSSSNNPRYQIFVDQSPPLHSVYHCFHLPLLLSSSVTVQCVSCGFQHKCTCTSPLLFCVYHYSLWSKPLSTKLQKWDLNSRELQGHRAVLKSSIRLCLREHNCRPEAVSVQLNTENRHTVVKTINMVVFFTFNLLIRFLIVCTGGMEVLCKNI